MSDFMRIGTASLRGFRNPAGAGTISVISNDGQDDTFVLSEDTLSWRGFPLTLFKDRLGRYSLAVIIEEGGTQQSSVYYRSERLALTPAAQTNLLSIKIATDEDQVAHGFARFRGMPLAVNQDGSLIVTPVEITAEQTESMYVMGVPLKVQRSGRHWFLVVGLTA